MHPFRKKAKIKNRFYIFFAYMAATMMLPPQGSCCRYYAAFWIGDVLLVDTNLAQAIVLNNAIAQQFPPHYRFDTHFIALWSCYCVKAAQFLLLFRAVSKSYILGNILLFFRISPTIPLSLVKQPLQALHIHFHIKSACSLYGQQRPDGNQPFLMELILSRRPFFRGVCSSQLRACLECIFEEFHTLNQNSDRLMQLYCEQLLLLLGRDLLAQCKANMDLYENSYLMDAILYINQHCSEKLVVGQNRKIRWRISTLFDKALSKIPGFEYLKLYHVYPYQ